MQHGTGGITKTLPPNLESNHSPASQCSESTPEESFKKDAERDFNLFNTLKEHTAWDDWRIRLAATSRAQDVDNLLNVRSGPSTPDENDLSVEKIKHVHYAFERVLHTGFFQKNEHSFVTQAAHKCLSE